MVKKNVLIMALIFGAFMAKGQSDNKEWIEINNIKWAKCNVACDRLFADNPTEGGFYQWNRTKCWSIPADTINKWDTTGDASQIWVALNDVCPAGWRLPYLDEIKSLIGSGSFSGSLDGTKGSFFHGKNNEGNEELLFFPYGTIGIDGELYNSKENYGNIWAQKGYNMEGIYNMNYHGGVSSWANQLKNRAYGFYVRCVCE